MITTLLPDWREGVSELGQPIREHTWEDCARALAVMDQQRRTIVVLSSDSAGDLSVAGGGGRYFVELATPSGAFSSVAFSTDDGTRGGSAQRCDGVPGIAVRVPANGESGAAAAPAQD